MSKYSGGMYCPSCYEKNYSSEPSEKLINSFGKLKLR
jgi:hypothetical protein